MTYNVYAMRDLKTGFLKPELDINHQAAIRNFKLGLATAHGESILGFAPEDFDLYYIGTFDTDSGIISPLTVPELVSSGGSLEV